METTVQGQQYLTAPELEHQCGNGTQETKLFSDENRKIKLCPLQFLTNDLAEVLQIYQM